MNARPAVKSRKNPGGSRFFLEKVKKKKMLYMSIYNTRGMMTRRSGKKKEETTWPKTRIARRESDWLARLIDLATKGWGGASVAAKKGGNGRDPWKWPPRSGVA